MSTTSLAAAAAAAAPAEPATPAAPASPPAGAAPTEPAAAAGNDLSLTTSSATTSAGEEKPEQQKDAGPPQPVELPEGFAEGLQAMRAEVILDAVKGLPPEHAPKVVAAVDSYLKAEAKAEAEQLATWRKEIEGRPNFQTEQKAIGEFLSRYDKGGTFTQNVLAQASVGDNPQVWAFLAGLSAMRPREDQGVGLQNGNGAANAAELPFDHPEFQRVMSPNTDKSYFGS